MFNLNCIALKWIMFVFLAYILKGNNKSLNLRLHKKFQGEFSSPFSYNHITNIVLKLIESGSPKFAKLECLRLETNSQVYTKRCNNTGVQKDNQLHKTEKKNDTRLTRMLFKGRYFYFFLPSNLVFFLKVYICEILFSGLD